MNRPASCTIGLTGLGSPLFSVVEMNTAAAMYRSLPRQMLSPHAVGWMLEDLGCVVDATG